MNIWRLFNVDLDFATAALTMIEKSTRAHSVLLNVHD
jgi:hypothetical protein